METDKRFVELYVFKATIDDVHGRALHKPYRVVAALAYNTLYHLAGFILLSFEFDFFDVFGFYPDLKNPWDCMEGYELLTDEGGGRGLEGVRRIKLRTVFDKVGKQMALVYDGINDWRIIVELVRIEKIEVNSVYNVVLEAVGEAPRQTEPWKIGRRERLWTLD